MTKIKRIRKGWIVCSKFGKRLAPKTVVHGRDGEVGLSGFGELYHSRKNAESDCKELNDSWKVKEFVVLKGQLSWEEET